MAPQTWKSGARCSPRQDDRSCQGSVSWPAQGVMTSHDRMISRAALCRHINMASRRETGDRQRRGGGRYAGQLGWRTGAAAYVIGICMRCQVQSQLCLKGSGVRVREGHTCEVPPPIISREARGSDARLNHIYVNRRVSSRLRQQTVLRHGTDGDSRPSHALHPRTIQPNTCTQNAWPTFVAAPTHSAGHRLSKHRATETARQLTAKSWPCVRRGCERFRRWQKSPRSP